MRTGTLLLGDSETFLGVITTLLVLCVFWGGGNLIIDILKGIRRQLVSTYKNKGIDESVFTEYENRIVEAHKKSLKCSAITDDLRKRLEDLLEEIRVYSGQLKDKMQSIYAFFEKANVKEEEGLAPFYAFIFCLFAFTCNEIVRFYPCSTNFMLIAMSVFTMFSSIYWSELWIKYWKRTKLPRYDELPARPGNWKIKRKWVRITIRIAWCLLCFGGLLWFLFFIYAKLPGQWMSKGTWLFVALFISAVLSVPRFGHTRIGNHPNKKGIRSMLFVLKHVLFFASVSIVLATAWRFASCLSTVIPGEEVFRENAGVIRGFIFGFAMLNGIVFPFLLPLFRLLGSDRYAEKMIKEIKQDYMNTRTTYETRVENLVSEDHS
jgi:hypothetical protein